jgi:hypothetical protein
MRTVLNGRGQPVVLTPENCTRDGHPWGRGIDWDDLEWTEAAFLDDSFLGLLAGFTDPHIRVPHKDKIEWNTHHRIRGKRWKITGLLPMEDRQP